MKSKRYLIARSNGTEDATIVIDDFVCHRPEAHEVVIRVKAVSLNYRDVLIFRDVVSNTKDMPVVLTSDGAGEVVSIGSSVTSLRPGDRVVAAFFPEWIDGLYSPKYREGALGGGRNGMLSEHVVLPAHALVKIPDSLSYEEAACLPCAAVTAWNALVSRANLTTNDTVLLQGTGGVSLFALQIAKSIGATTILITGSPEKLGRHKSAQPDHVINYRKVAHWEERVMELTKGEGVTHVVELLGNSNLSRSVSVLRGGGHISYIGCLDGFEGSFDPLQLMYKNGTLEAIYVGSVADLKTVTHEFASNNIHPIIDRVYSFMEAPAALRYFMSAQHAGKVVVRL